MLLLMAAITPVGLSAAGRSLGEFDFERRLGSSFDRFDFASASNEYPNVPEVVFPDVYDGDESPDEPDVVHQMQESFHWDRCSSSSHHASTSWSRFLPGEVSPSNSESSLGIDSPRSRRSPRSRPVQEDDHFFDPPEAAAEADHHLKSPRGRRTVAANNGAGVQQLTASTPDHLSPPAAESEEEPPRLSSPSPPRRGGSPSTSQVRAETVRDEEEQGRETVGSSTMSSARQSFLGRPKPKPKPTSTSTSAASKGDSEQNGCRETSFAKSGLPRFRDKTAARERKRFSRDMFRSLPGEDELEELASSSAQDYTCSSRSRGADPDAEAYPCEGAPKLPHQPTAPAPGGPRPTTAHDGRGGRRRKSDRNRFHTTPGRLIGHDENRNHNRISQEMLVGYDAALLLAVGLGVAGLAGCVWVLSLCRKSCRPSSRERNEQEYRDAEGVLSLGGPNHSVFLRYSGVSRERSSPYTESSFYGFGSSSIPFSEEERGGRSPMPTTDPNARRSYMASSCRSRLPIP